MVYNLEEAKKAKDSVQKLGQELGIPIKGEFVPIGQGNTFYLFEIFQSRPAKGAKYRDFLVKQESVASETILPLPPDTFDVVIEVDFLVVPEKVKYMSQTDAQKSLEEAPKVVSEDALNAVIIHQLLHVLEDKKIMPTLKGGNIAIGNEQRGVENFSLYYKSRPDFMLCTDTLGVVVFAEEEEEEECTGPSLLDTITGFVTENKRVTSGDHLGQLLGSMEKLAGDMAASRLRTGGPFAEIHIFGLLVKYIRKEALPYLLVMNFSFIYSKGRLEQASFG